MQVARWTVHYLFTGAQEKISTIDNFPTYSGFGKLFP